ncbi:MAG: IS21 family transposase [Nitrosomonadales bacterium]|nr:IS21 family transposase [Nitrosomonadales bacterium]
MPVRQVSMRKIKECLRMKWSCGLSHAQIAKALGLSKGVISKYAQLALAAGLDWDKVLSLDETALQHLLIPGTKRHRGARPLPDWAIVHREMHKKGITLQLLWEEYVEAHNGVATYRYTQFCSLYHDHAATLKRSMRQIHRAGEKLFIDYAGPTVPIIDQLSGEISQAHIFVAVLGASNYTYACATARETQADWLRGLTGALHFIGGVPEMIVPDCPKALVTDADRYEPLINRVAQDCARHYGTVILPARPRHPQDKALAEVGVQIVERWILARLRRRTFFSLAELNQAIRPLLDDLNRRPFQKKDGCREEWFQLLDRPVLKVLPAHPYEIATFKYCKVNIDYHVDIEGHYYSVPHSLVRQELEARITCATVELLFRGSRVACHAKSTKRGAHTTVSAHMPAAHRAHLEWSPQRLLDWGRDIGPNTHRIVDYQLTSKPHPEMGYRACLGLLSLARQYGRERLEAACARAVSLGAPNRRSVVNILKAGLDSKPLPATPKEQQAAQTDWISPLHGNVRGSSYYH